MATTIDVLLSHFFKLFERCVFKNLKQGIFSNKSVFKKAQFLRDGRAVIDTIGGRRFKVVRRNLKDGYCVADVVALGAD